MAEAEAHCHEVPTRDPKYLKAYRTLGGPHTQAGHFEGVALVYETATALDPHSDAFLVGQLHVQSHMCDWRWCERFQAVESELGFRDGSVPDVSRVVAPVSSISASSSLP